MTESSQTTLLRRMTRSQGQDSAETPLTSSRAVRLTLTKAANDTIGLVLTVSSVGEEVTGLDDMLGLMDDGLMLVGLERDDALLGMLAIDMELRAAIVEMQTMGALLGLKAEQRAPTGTDKMLCDPLIAALLSSFPQALSGTPLEGWLDHVAPAAQIANTRAAGLVLEDRDYRIVTMEVDLGIADRSGVLRIALPPAASPQPAEVPAPAEIGWDAALHAAINEAPAQLDALLHRFPISLATAQDLHVGAVLNLSGCTVNSVRLLAKDGKTVAQAKLGQVGGYRAVRIEDAPMPQLHELTPADAPLPRAEPSLLENTDVEGTDILADSVQMTDGAAPANIAGDLSDTMVAMPDELDPA